jgi:hypothetical protein
MGDTYALSREKTYKAAFENAAKRIKNSKAESGLEDALHHVGGQS